MVSKIPYNKVRDFESIFYFLAFFLVLLRSFMNFVIIAFSVIISLIPPITVFASFDISFVSSAIKSNFRMSLLSFIPTITDTTVIITNPTLAITKNMSIFTISFIVLLLIYKIFLNNIPIYVLKKIGNILFLSTWLIVSNIRVFPHIKCEDHIATI